VVVVVGGGGSPLVDERHVLRRTRLHAVEDADLVEGAARGYSRIGMATLLLCFMYAAQRSDTLWLHTSLTILH
jgi:hypothetical protein